MYCQEGVSNVYSLFRRSVSIHQNVTQEFHFEAPLIPESGTGYMQGGLDSTVITSKTQETTQYWLTGV